MKIATIVHDAPIRMPREALFKAWVDQALKAFEASDIVLMLEPGSKYKHLWSQTVELQPLEGFEPHYSLQHLVFSDYYKAQGYHLIGSPVLVLDLDCHVQIDLPEWSDAVYRMAQHNPGTAPEADTVNGQNIRHLNCAVQYQGADHFSRFRECVDEVASDNEQRKNWMLGEVAFSLLFHRLEAEGGQVETLPLEYSWYAGTSPHPDDVKILHYGREARDILLRNIGLLPDRSENG